MANYKSAISFGLVHIPVGLNPAIKNNDTSFNMLHNKCNTRIKYQKFCPHCKKEVNQADIIRGYQYSKDNYVTISDEEFDKLKSINDKMIEIVSFVNIDEIDPIYFEKNYILMHEGKSKAFSLFKTALEKQGKVAIAKTVLGNKSYYAILRFGNNNIIMSTLYYEEEVKKVEQELIEDFSKQELDLAIKLIDSMKGKFEPQNYQDEYQNRVKKALEQKISGKEIKQVKNKKSKTISDLMTALEKSLTTSKKKTA